MPVAFRKVLALSILKVSLISQVLAQSEAVTSPASSEVKDLAVALVRVKSVQEQEHLLTQKESTPASLLAALKALAAPLIQKGDLNEALRISRLAVRIAEKTGDRMQLGLALYEVGHIQARRIPPEEALNHLEKSLAIFEELGAKKEQARALLAMAIAYDNERRRDLAIKTGVKALALSESLNDKELTARILNILGTAHTERGNLETGLEYYHKARVLSESVNDKVTLNQVFNNIGRLYTAQGRYAEGLDYLHKSLKIVEEMGSGDRRSVANKLQSIGLIYRRQGRLDQALAYARRSLAIFEETDDKFGITNIQNNIGVIYKAQGSYAEALEWFQKALHGYEQLKATPGIARSLNNIGDTYRLQGHYDKALEPLQQGLRLREQLTDRGAVSLSLNNLGRLYQDQRKYAEMLDVSRRAAQVAASLNDKEELWAAQERIGRALFGLGQLEEARNSFVASISTLESLRRNVAGGEQQQQSFLENRLSPWFGLIDLLISQQQYAEALTVAEQSKARVLLDTLQAGRANIRQSWSKEEQQADEQHRLRLVSLNSKLTAEVRRDKPDASRVAELKAEVEKARLEYEDFETRLYVAHPELRVQRGEAPIIKPEELTTLLPDASSALLEYVVGQDETYLFVVTKGNQQSNVRVYTLPVKSDELAKQTEAFRQQLAGRDLGFRTSAAKLYDLLIKPAEAQLRGKTNLIIANDNTLWDLPFQALVNGANRFMIEDAAIAYTPSLTVLREMSKRRQRGAGAPTLLALGNPSLGNDTIKRAALTPRDGKLDPLPEAEQEVKSLGRLYGGSRSKIYIGADAREERVKSEASKATILHFATHAMLNNASPMYSHLALAGGGANEDGLLEAWELMQLDLQADLAVLSACETARGRVGAGEGMIGLSWAMFMAGVPSIVVSQWKVESAGTRDLMVNFHGALISSKPTKREALRQAALKLMKNPETSHPFYWAGFVLVGDGR
ncbi:MAG TPA: CHAT domain-containing tetratricopeptide repeat protein [Pyrinomonadaceae bacterium]|nr:CHAT domain-containing tetratricopeptide repeat protein [Pyrinomonadaceae bacterium]